MPKPLLNVSKGNPYESDLQQPMSQTQKLSKVIEDPRAFLTTNTYNSSTTPTAVI
jgi:hypothetical protein